MTKKQAMQELVETGKLTTKLLAPLGISFETFLRFAQRSDAAEIKAKLIAGYAKELGL